MKTRGKVLLATLSAAMLVTASVMGTLAYLQDSETVSNTFTVGNVAITLDEAVTGLDGIVTSGRTEDGNKYKLMPGHDYDKDPTITVTGSEPAWLFVKVDNGIAAIEAPNGALKSDGKTAYVSIAKQMEAKGWVEVDTGIYAYDKEPVDPTESVVVFEEFMVSGDAVGSVEEGADKTMLLSEYETAKIDITAYAVQADGFTSAAAAWNAAKDAF
ncbi:MAG: hypothetical protein IJD13_04520 [Oscillospiraceae bacterium]|nr:hypothetical protein [Oscillospiraceae bacterium]